MGNLGEIIVATGFEKLPKVIKIAQSGHMLACVNTPFTCDDCFVSNSFLVVKQSVANLRNILQL